DVLGLGGRALAADPGVASVVAQSPEAAPALRLPDRVADVAQRDPVAASRVEIERDLHLVRLDALELDARDSVDPLDRPHDLSLDQVVLAIEVLVAGDPHPHDRLVGGT